MPISPVSKSQPMRPAEIAAIDALNLAIEQLNNLDVSGLNERLSGIESSISSLNTRVDGIASSVSTIESSIATIETDVENIKITLYTPLDESTE